jgi:hypothetical protein
MEGGNTTVLESTSMMMRSTSRKTRFSPVPPRVQAGTPAADFRQADFFHIAFFGFMAVRC